MKKDPRKKMIPGRLVGKTLVNGLDELAVFRVEALDGEVPEFLAGQFTRLAWDYEGEVEMRTYSIQSEPEMRDVLEFYIVDTKFGLGTSHLFGFEPGKEVWIAKPVGKFTFERHFAPHITLVGSGTGIAPYIGMVRHLIAEHAAGRPIPESVSIWHGVRSSSELGFREELLELEKDAPFLFRYVPCVSRHHDEPDFETERVHRGRVNEILAKLLELKVSEDPRGIEFATGANIAELRTMVPEKDGLIMLCGNPAMIQAFEDVAAGTPWAEQMIFERWW